jgi:hypothetical protein
MIAKHPVLLGFAILFGMAALTAWPWLLIPLFMAPAAWYGTLWHDRRYQQLRYHRQALAAHADYEHHALIYGDPRGWYGAYPPAI